jgi:RimJ/RimL family protein N-acetyltransferase
VMRFLGFYWTARGALSPERWSLPFAVVADGDVIGTQDLMAEEFAGSRSVSSGSWLTQSAQGRGIGVEMRAAVLHLAFAGLGALEAQTSAWIDNVASQRVSLRLGYLPDGEVLMARRGEPTRHLRFRLTRDAWAHTHFEGIEIHGHEPCLPLLGAA